MGIPKSVRLILDGASLQASDPTVRSEVERGPAKVRVDATDLLMTSTAALVYRTPVALAEFRAWFYSPAGGGSGAAWFSWVDPQGITRQARIITGSLGPLKPLRGAYAASTQTCSVEYVETKEEIAAAGPRRWDFVSSVEGWQAFGGFSTIAWSAGFLQARPVTTKYAIVESPPALAVRGGMYTKVRAGIKRVAGTGWAGNLFYITGAHGEDFAYRKNIANPLPSIGVTVPVEWDMAKLTAGGSDWQSSTITSIRMDLGGSDLDQFDIDWVEIVAP